MAGAFLLSNASPEQIRHAISQSCFGVNSLSATAGALSGNRSTVIQAPQLKQNSNKKIEH